MKCCGDPGDCNKCEESPYTKAIERGAKEGLNYHIIVALNDEITRKDKEIAAYRETLEFLARHPEDTLLSPPEVSDMARAVLKEYE